LHVGELRVAGADDGHGPVEALFAVVGGEPGAVAQGFERCEDGRPRLVGPGFEVDEEVEGLGGGGVEDAVLLAFLGEGRLGVLALESREDGVDVEGLEGALGCESAGFVTDLMVS
jgi:hypothetical protein